MADSPDQSGVGFEGRGGEAAVAIAVHRQDVHVVDEGPSNEPVSRPDPRTSVHGGDAGPFAPTPDEIRNGSAQRNGAVVAMPADGWGHALMLVVVGQNPPPGPQARSGRQRCRIHLPDDAFDAGPFCLATRMVTRRRPRRGGVVVLRRGSGFPYEVGVTVTASLATPVPRLLVARIRMPYPMSLVSPVTV